LRVAIRLHLAPRRHTVMLAALIVAFLVRPLIGDSGFAPTLFMVTGTNGPTPPVVTIMPGLGQSYLGIQAYGTQSNGAAQFLIANFPANTSITPNSPPTVNVYDLTTATPAVSTPIIANGGGAGMITGPDGCIYLAQGVAVWRITDTSGECNYTAQNPPPALSLTPATFSSHAAQGSPISLTATVHFGQYRFQRRRRPHLHRSASRHRHDRCVRDSQALPSPRIRRWSLGVPVLM